jgi:hypothetical protein
MSMSMARAAPMEDMLLRLYVVGFCGVTTGTFVTLYRSRRRLNQKKAPVEWMLVETSSVQFACL